MTSFSRSLILVALMMVLSTPSEGQIEIESYRVYGIASEVIRPLVTRGVAAADFDGDGDLDLALTSFQANSTITLMKQNSLGVFQRRYSTWSWGSPDPIVSADFDQDGNADIVFGDRCKSPAPIVVQLGDGEFGFPVTRSLQNSKDPRDLAVGDFNGDGFLDLVSANLGEPGSVSLFLGYSQGRFEEARVFSVPDRPHSISVGDFDGDGHLDAATANLLTSGLTVLWGDGQGNLSPSTNLPVVGNAISPRAADLDDDGFTDLIVPNPDADTVTLYYGNDDRTFALPRTVSVGDMPGAVEVFDVNQDGFLDLVVANTLDSNLTLLHGRGSRFYRSDRTIYVGRQLRALALADLDGDGVQDLIGITRQSQSVMIFSSHQNKTILGIPNSAPGGIGIASADFDGDGHLDAMVRAQNDFTLQLGDGLGNFTDAGTFSGPRTPLAIGDVNEDGFPDLLYMRSPSPGQHQLALRLNDQAGSLLPEIVETMNKTTDITLADFDEDTHLDLLMISSCVGDEWTMLLTGDGTGNFGNPINHPYVGHSPVVGDFNNDGCLDFAARFDAFVQVVLGDGQGDFGVPLSVPMPGPYFQVGDLNDDGNLDLVGFDVHRYRSALGNGYGQFASGPTSAYPRMDSLNEFQLVDLDEDGFLDIVAERPLGNSIMILPGIGNGAFGQRQLFGTSDELAGFTIGDFDGDGHQDVLSTGICTSLLRNRTFDLLDVRKGNVNATVGPIADVLFVNGETGDGPERQLFVDKDEPFKLSILRPPSLPTGPVDYAIYADFIEPTLRDAHPLPFGFGRIGILSPMTGHEPRVTFNTVGSFPLLGHPTRTTASGPGCIVERSRGVKRQIKFYIQGFVTDPASPQSELAVTNGILINSQ